MKVDTLNIAKAKTCKTIFLTLNESYLSVEIYFLILTNASIKKPVVVFQRKEKMSMFQVTPLIYLFYLNYP